MELLHDIFFISFFILFPPLFFPNKVVICMIHETSFSKGSVVRKGQKTDVLHILASKVII